MSADDDERTLGPPPVVSGKYPAAEPSAAEPEATTVEQGRTTGQQIWLWLLGVAVVMVVVGLAIGERGVLLFFGGALLAGMATTAIRTGSRRRYQGSDVVGAVMTPGPNHLLHFLLTLLTCGLWLPIWILIAIVDRPKLIRVDKYGNIIR